MKKNYVLGQAFGWGDCMETFIWTCVSIMTVVLVIVCCIVFSNMKKRNVLCPNCSAKYQAECIKSAIVIKTDPFFITLLVVVCCLNCLQERQIKIKVRNRIGESMDVKYLAAQYFEGHHDD